MIKLSSIKEKIKKDFDLTEKKWVFVSWFDVEWNLLFSKWILFTSQSIETNLWKLYDKFIVVNKKINTLLVDIVKNKIEIMSIDDLKGINMKKYWLFVWEQNSSKWDVILPDTKEIVDSIHAISVIKQKTEFSSNLVNIFVFTTKRYTFYL